MNIVKTPFEGLLIIEPKVHADSRGYFFEAYNRRALKVAGIDFDSVQENQSQSKKNTIRGLHFQKAPHEQAKLVRVIRGKILDVVLDLRSNSVTFQKLFSVELSAEERKCLLVPKGFAHGYAVLSEEAEIIYCCDDYYYPELEAGVRWNDPALRIDWKIDATKGIVSDKDMKLPTLSEVGRVS
jgi:dTDP-4-dehydrorhamnose 3,5-epimerase